MPSGSAQEIRKLEELLTQLKSCASLAPYNLTLYLRVHGVTPVHYGFYTCCSLVQDRLSRDAARQFFERDLEIFFAEGTTSVCRYGGGFLGFVAPFTDGGRDFCLVGDGVRDATLDLWQLAAFSRKGGGEAFSLLPHVETLPTATLEEVEEVARDVSRRAKLFFSCRNEALPLPPPPADADARLAAVAKVTELLERSNSIAATIALCCETIQEHFEVAGLALALREGGSEYLVSGIWGVPEELGTLPADALSLFLAPEKIKKVVPLDAQMRQALPALHASAIACFPLRPQGEQLGFLAAVDSSLQQSDLLLISMVANGTGSRISRIIAEAEQSRASAISKRLMSFSSTLSQVDNKEELYETILGIAAELIDATQGSIMLIDSNGESMHIVFTLGMTLDVARCLTVKVGQGIAGLVAQSGEPLLVNDVEKDSRLAMRNRSRFKSKSLLCVPLKLKNKIIGVLNLSDKTDLSPFNQGDLQLLTSFANLASLMIERTLVLEQSVKFEQLSVTDSLTGLYNRRFLKSRVEEEINRSERQGLQLAVLFIDLDFFKNYNDICGHLAGDLALKRTADIIKATLREMDVVARYGGEEFCAVLPGTSKAEAVVVAERIRAEIESETFLGETDIPTRQITASVGVATYPEDGATYTDLVHASDLALYEAKAQGRNRTVAADARSSALHPAPHRSARSAPVTAGHSPVKLPSPDEPAAVSAQPEALLRSGGPPVDQQGEPLEGTAAAPRGVQEAWGAAAASPLWEQPRQVSLPAEQGKGVAESPQVAKCGPAVPGAAAACVAAPPAAPADAAGLTAATSGGTALLVRGMDFNALLEATVDLPPQLSKPPR